MSKTNLKNTLFINILPNKVLKKNAFWGILINFATKNLRRIATKKQKSKKSCYPKGLLMTIDLC
ncbi:MAG TPA: hypothetical protein DIS88_08520 [Prevotella sp.]|nr:hypothetical protein [Prevotella sp.]